MVIKELITTYPKVSIIIISFLITFGLTLFTKKFSNQKRMRELKDIQKACQIQLKNNKGNPQELQKIQKQMMECSMELMKHSFKPTLYTMAPLLILIFWIKGIYSTVLPGWIWWYIVTGVVSSIILRKVLKVV